MKTKFCTKCGKQKPIWKNLGNGVLLCKGCSSTTGVANNTGESKPKLEHSRISPKSSKKVKLDVAYMALREIFLRDHPMCQIRIPGICTLKATQIHHTYAGSDREEYYLDTTTWKSCDQNCHTWVHDNDHDARMLGLLK